MNGKAMRVEIANGLARLTFIQSARGNPIDGDFCAEFGEVADMLSSDPKVRAVLIRAEGKAFSFGGDIGAFVADLDALPRLIRRWTADLHVGIARMQRMNAPIVTAVHGICAGGMVGVVAGSDVLVAAPEARFVAAYPGIGFSCDASSSVMLSRRLGIARARRFLVTNETLDAEAAAKAGLVDEVVAADALVARAEEIAVKLAAGPTLALGEIRRLMISVGDQPLDAQLELEAQALARIASTHDAREGLSAFAEKRKARFEGR